MRTPRKIQSKALCAYCGAESAKNGMSRHLEACLQRMEVIAKAENSAGVPETLIQLRVQDAYSGRYWLDLEMRGSATLSHLDAYLRAIWLDCCGHLSEFMTGSWSGDTIGMNRRADRVFAPGIELMHIYDFGTSSETRIKALAVRRGKPTTKHAIALMARNVPPAALCVECGLPAKQICMECVIEHDNPGLLCDKHAKRHPHEEYGQLPVLNSPRMGMCGYDGPANPPY